MEDLLTKKLREKTRTVLFGRYGAVTRVAREVKVNKDTVYAVLNGEYDNDRVLQACADEALRLIAEREETVKKMQQVADRLNA